MLTKKYPILGSSVDPNELSLTIKGLLIGLVPLAIAIGNMSGLNLTEAYLMEVINTLFIVVSGVITLYGLFRKIKK